MLLSGCGQKGEELVIKDRIPQERRTDGTTVTAVTSGSAGQVRTTTQNGETSVSTRGSMMKVGGKNIDLGIEIYPGAHVAEGGTMSADGPSAKVKMAHFSTPDPVSKVTAFYKRKLGNGVASAGGSVGGNEAQSLSKKDGSVSWSINVSRNEGDKETHFSIMRAED